jgi:hypothetical protein
MLRTLTVALILTLLLNTCVTAAESASIASAKSRGTALSYSLLCTLVPAAVGGTLILDGSRGSQTDNTEALVGLTMGLAGVVLGPGVGHAYSESSGRFWKGIAIRGAAASFTAAISLSDSKTSLSIGDGIEQHLMTLAIGGTVCLASATYDIATAGDSADTHNRNRGLASIRIAPAYFASSKAPGVTLTMSF